MVDVFFSRVFPVLAVVAWMIGVALLIAELIEEVRPAMVVSRPIYRRSAGLPVEGGVRLGQRVRHGKFGEGIVLNSEGSGTHARVQVNFESAGTKWLVVAYANLELM